MRIGDYLIDYLIDGKWVQVGLLVAHGRSSFGRDPFFLPPVTRIPAAVKPRLAGCKSVASTTEPRLVLLNNVQKIQNSWCAIIFCL